MNPNHTNQGLLALAERLLKAPVDAITSAAPGGNNRIFCIDAGDNRYALKVYPDQAGDPRDRCKAETQALSFLSQSGIRQVPALVTHDSENSCALYQWIEGTPIDAMTDTDIDEMGRFLISLQALRGNAVEAGIAPASAACFSAGDIVGQLRTRIDRLRAVAPDHPELSDYLEADLLPTINRIVAKSLERWDSAGLSPNQTLTEALRILSPSDFGRHNSLRTQDGNLAFLDFEYFGWDDPVKAVADIMLHPGSAFTEDQQQKFFAVVTPFFEAGDPSFLGRFDAMYPLFGLIWCVIMLNAFLPERQERRKIASRNDANGIIHLNQLAKSRNLLNRIVVLNDT